MHRVILAAALLGLTVPPATAQAPSNGAGDEAAIRKSVEAYVAALNRGEVDQVLSYWAEDADYVDETGKAHRGRDAIAALFKKHVQELKGHKVKIDIKSLRFLKPDVAIEDGQLELLSPEGAAETSRYTAVWIKAKDKWLISSARDLPAEGRSTAADGARRLKELEWLIGEWSAEHEGTTVTLSCRWGLNQHFLVQEYTVKEKEGEALSVAQWVGWDPMHGQLRSWVFDSRGGFGGGAWTRKGNTWSVTAGGILPDGRTGSALHVVKFVNDTSFVWRSTDRQIEGSPVADSEVKFARRAAKP